MRYRNIIWDWNGTIFDDAALCRDITKGHITQLGLPERTDTELQRAFKHPVKDFYESIGFDWSGYTFEEIALSFIQEYERRMSEASIRPEMKTLILHLQSAGVAQFVLSAVRHDLLETSIRSAELSHCFERWVGLLDAYAASKVENGLGLVRDQGLDPKDTVLIGDTTHDLEVAQQIGVDVILVPSGYQHADILHDSGAAFVENYGDLQAMLEFLEAS